MPAPKLPTWSDLSALTGVSGQSGQSGPFFGTAAGRQPDCPWLLADRRLELDTPYGTLTPQHAPDEPRRCQVKALLFHPGGELRTLPLQERTWISTPVGRIQAELLTFYPSGALCRIFPSDGELSGFWTWENEFARSAPQSVATPLGRLERHFLALHFYESGKLKSLTLWPEDRIQVPAAGMMIEGRIGVAFYEHGAVRRLEPARPTRVPTPIGPLTAYDPDALGIHGDNGSLGLFPDGSVEELLTVHDRIEASGPGFREVWEPLMRPGTCHPDQLEPGPMPVVFEPGGVRLGAAPSRFFDSAGTVFKARPRMLFGDMPGLGGPPACGLRV